MFPSVRTATRAISDNTLNAALRRLRLPKDGATARGFRATASSLLKEFGEWHPDGIERQLGHVENNDVRRAYAPGEHWDQRVKMMQWWGDYLGVLKSACKIKGPGCIPVGGYGPATNEYEVSMFPLQGASEFDQAHNLKVGGSNPPTATKLSFEDISALSGTLPPLEASPLAPSQHCGSKRALNRAKTRVVCKQNGYCRRRRSKCRRERCIGIVHAGANAVSGLLWLVGNKAATGATPAPEHV